MVSFVGRFSLGFLVATPVLALIAVAAAGGGDGAYYPAKILFPYTMASTTATGRITLPFIVLGLAQYPIYGLILDWARSTNRLRQCLIILLGVHAVSAYLAFAFSNPSFTP